MEQIERDLEKERIAIEEKYNVVFHCDRCGAEIYENDNYYSYEGDCLCEECFDEVQSDEKAMARRVAGDEDDY